ALGPRSGSDSATLVSTFPDGERKQHYGDGAGTGKVDRPTHPLQMLRHNHPWIGLAIIHAAPSIPRVFPTSFEFFGCHNISPPLTPNEKEISDPALWELECAWFESLQQSAGLASSIA